VIFDAVVSRAAPWADSASAWGMQAGWNVLVGIRIQLASFVVFFLQLRFGIALRRY